MYFSRKKYLKREKEKKLWEEINWEFMTEESSGDDSFLNKHVLPWRSEGSFYLLGWFVNYFNLQACSQKLLLGGSFVQNVDLFTF